MQQPPGFEIPGMESKVCLLRKSIYGLKQSPRQWYEEFDTFLRSIGWVRSQYDPNLYFFREGDSIVIIMLYVDDLLITGNCPKKICAVKQQLQDRYRMKDLGLVHRYLGVDFVRTIDHGLFLHQQEYTEALLQESGMLDSNCEFIPLPMGHVLTSETHTPSVDLHEYCHIVGKLIFLCHTRPDIAYAVGLVSRFMHCPQRLHWESVQHILRYLNYTKDFGILYNRSTDITLHGFTDADYLGCPDTRQSVGAYLFQLAAGPISWSSKQQSTVSDSTTEAEYKALSEGAKEAVYVRRLFQELQVFSPLTLPLTCSDVPIHNDLHGATTPSQMDTHLSCDNQGAVKLAKNPIFHAKTKHIEAKHHFIRERVLEGEISLKYIHTDDNPADLLTKPLLRQKFELHRESMGVISRAQLRELTT